MPENTPTTISDMSNSNAKDGLLKDVHTRKRKSRKRTDKPTLRKTIFGPHSQT